MAAPPLHWRDTAHYVARVFFLLLAILVFLTMLGGCGYQVHLRGVQLVEQFAVPQGATIWVAPSPSAQESADDDAIRDKIEILLKEKGYEVSDEATANHYLFFSHEIESLMSRMSLELTTGVRGGMGTNRREGPFDRRLSLRLVEAETFQAGEDDSLWASTAVIRGAPTESPKFDDLLLLATFRHFPDDTGQTVIERLNLESRQARRLR